MRQSDKRILLALGLLVVTVIGIKFYKTYLNKTRKYGICGSSVGQFCQESLGHPQNVIACLVANVNKLEAGCARAVRAKFIKTKAASSAVRPAKARKSQPKSRAKIPKGPGCRAADLKKAKCQKSQQKWLCLARNASVLSTVSENCLWKVAKRAARDDKKCFQSLVSQCKASSGLWERYSCISQIKAVPAPCKALQAGLRNVSVDYQRRQK